ncbi:hypothetical protein HJFPF1_09321 [Paramyrothecium foliicola]|nr:hypothetical protein HJFPF1_09321 [Paramyrothecium foliicola]
MVGYVYRTGNDSDNQNLDSKPYIIGQFSISVVIFNADAILQDDSLLIKGTGLQADSYLDVACSTKHGGICLRARGWLVRGFRSGRLTFGDSGITETVRSDGSEETFEKKGAFLLAGTKGRPVMVTLRDQDTAWCTIEEGGPRPPPYPVSP